MLYFLHQDHVIDNSLLHYELSRCVSSMRCDLVWLWGFLQLILSICERFICPIMSCARFFLQTVSLFLWSVLVPQGHETRTWYSCSWKIWFVSDICFYSSGPPEMFIDSWKCYQTSKNCVCIYGLNFQRSCLTLICSHLWFHGAKYACRAAKPFTALGCGRLGEITQVECRLQIEQVIPDL